MECFKLEYDVSVIAVSQVLLEHELDIFIKKHSIEPSDSYKKNIDIAYENNLITEDLKKLLDESREFRNIILHPDPNKDTRFLEDIAVISITAVAEFLKESSEPIK